MTKRTALLLSVAVVFAGAMSSRAAQGQVAPPPPPPPSNPNFVPFEPAPPGGATVAPSDMPPRAESDGEEPPRVRFPTAEPRFGDQGKIVLSGILDASFGHLVYSAGNDASTSFRVEPAFEYFVLPDLSVGASAFFGYSDSTSGIAINDKNVQYGVTGKVGSNIWMGNIVSLWPRFALGVWQSRSTFSGSSGYVSIDGSSFPIGPGTEITENAMFIEVYAPVLLHPCPHFFVGIGPDGYLDLFHSASGLPNKRSFYGLSSTVGGWF